MKRFVKLYGASPLHLLAVISSLAIAGYAAQRLIETQTMKIVIWFVAAAVLHDVLLLPLYAIADRSLTEVWRRSPESAETVAVPWLNYVRFPTAISLLLLLVYWPEISRRHTILAATSHLSTRLYLSHWLLITGILFTISALTYAVQLRRAAKHHASDTIRVT